MATEILRFESATELRSAAESFLLRNEAHHCLLVGLIRTLETAPDFYGPGAYYAAVAKNGEIVAAALMTPPHPLVLSLCEDESALRLLAADVYGVEPVATGVTAPAPAAGRFAEAWHEVSGDSFVLGLAERVYRLDHVKAPQVVSGRMRRAAEADLDLLTSWHIAFAREAVPWEEASRDATERGVLRGLRASREVRGTFLWEDGQPVCLVGYSGPTPNGLRIGPVYTPPEFRRRGYASACTAAACQYILDSGRRFVTLFADLANPTSNHIYREIGFEPVCDAEMVRFGGR